MIYLDYAATTPDLTDYKEIQNVVEKYWGNPSSSHICGRQARSLIEDARHQIATYLHCNDSDLIFTSGATESNNLAITGWAKKLINDDTSYRPWSIMYSATAHHSMTEPASTAFQLKGGSSIKLKVKKNGQLDEDYLENWLNEYDRTGVKPLVCFEWVNNETGVIQRIRELIELCHKYNAQVLVDAVQALPIINISLESLGADYVSFSAHKIYGPKGIGILYCKNKELFPINQGGSQEYNLRAGTENFTGILGFSQAILRLKHNKTDDFTTCEELKKTLIKSLISNYGSCVINGGDVSYHSPSIININCGVDGAALAMVLENKGYLVSTGAACDGTTEQSHVLLAMGLEDASTQSIRISFSGRFTTKKQMEEFGQVLAESIKELQV